MSDALIKQSHMPSKNHALFLIADSYREQQPHYLIVASYSDGDLHGKVPYGGACSVQKSLVIDIFFTALSRDIAIYIPRFYNHAKASTLKLHNRIGNRDSRYYHVLC